MPNRSTPAFVLLTIFSCVLAPALPFADHLRGEERRQERSPGSGTALPLLDPSRFDRAAAAHLLARAGFTPSAAEIDRLQALGLEKAVESLLSPPADDPLPPFQPSLADRPSPRDLAGMEKAARQKVIREHRVQDREQLQQLRAWWLRRMVLTASPLAEKMVLFWHGHFATSQQGVRNSYHLFLQNQLLRRHALGNFKELTRAIARDPAMLAYLNNNRNVRRAPNENFARELLELFTLGIGNYTERDVQEGARALTGFSFQGNEFVFRRGTHDPGEKTFLGRSGRLDGDDVVDAIFETEAAARFLPRKLFVFFAHDDPPAPVLEALALAFREGGFEVRPVLSLIFRSEEFYAPRARGSRIKSPVELVAGTLRLLGIDPGDSPAPAAQAGRMGQELFLPPSVKGWDGGRSWISTSSLLDRYDFSRRLLGIPEPPAEPSGEPTVDSAGGPRAVRRPGGSAKKEGAAVATVRRRAAAPGRIPRFDAAAFERDLRGPDGRELAPAELVDRVLGRFLLVPLGEEARGKLVEFCRAAPAKERLTGLLHLVMSSPEYQLN